MRIYNTLTRQKEEFVPITPGEAKIYACVPQFIILSISETPGPCACLTFFADTWNTGGMKVTFVQNFTDIDDKIIRKANEEKTDYLTVAERYIQEYETDARGLNIRGGHRPSESHRDHGTDYRNYLGFGEKGLRL
ncbi:MAG: hypothetical protein V8T62_08555 [Oscillospiraceae bacterium]